MYIGIDIGGSKTLIASFSDAETIISQKKFPTPATAEKLVDSLIENMHEVLGSSQPEGIGLAAPGNFTNGHFTNTTTLGWHDVPLLDLFTSRVQCPVYAENDAVLGGLAEARIGNGQNCTNLLYITISTGVGTGIIINGNIPKFIPGSEGGLMLIGESSETIQSRVSGTAFKKRYGKYGYEVEDPRIWKEYAHDLARAIYDMSALIEPDRVVLGGGMSLHFDKFSRPLLTTFHELNHGEFEPPEILRATYPELAVIYGCAILAREGAHNE